jgi:hypothetical protein
VPAIIAPDAEFRFAVDEVITLEGSATDPENGPLPDSSLTWEVRRHHNEHFHPWLPPTTGNHVAFAGPPPEELSAESKEWLEIVFTATDLQGLSTTITQTLWPNSVSITLTSEPAGLPFSVNDSTVVGPYSLFSREGLGVDIGASAFFVVSGIPLHFVSWSDGGAANHTLLTPSAPMTYTVTYTVTPKVNTLLREDRPTRLSYSLSGNSLAPAGVLRIDMRLRNGSSSTIDDLFFLIKKLNGGTLLNADGAPGATGATLTLPVEATGGDGLIQPGETFPVTFRIGLTSLSGLRLALDAYGLIEEDDISATGEDAGIVIDISAEELQSLIHDNFLYLPNLDR